MPCVSTKTRIQPQSGFTLIEILLMCVLLATLFLITAPSVSKHLSSGNLEQSRHELKELIRSTQQQAVSESTSYRITWDTNTNHYLIYVNSGSWALVSTNAMPSGITLVSTSLTSNQVDFDRLGNPSSGGSIVLRDSDGATASIDIVAGSGMVRLP